MPFKRSIILAVSSFMISCGNVDFSFFFNVGGTVDGLVGTLIIDNNGIEEISIRVNEPFTFPTPLSDGSTYSVSVRTNPEGQTCTVSNGSGTIHGADALNVSITCRD